MPDYDDYYRQIAASRARGAWAGQEPAWRQYGERYRDRPGVGDYALDWLGRGVAGGIAGGPYGAMAGVGSGMAEALGREFGAPQLGQYGAMALQALMQRQMMESQQAEQKQRFSEEMGLRREQMAQQERIAGMEFGPVAQQRDFGKQVAQALMSRGGAEGALGLGTAGMLAGVMPPRAPQEYQEEAQGRDAMIQEIARERAEMARERQAAMLPEGVRARGMESYISPPREPTPQRFGESRQMLEEAPPESFRRMAPAQEQLEPMGEPPWTVGRQVGYAADVLGGMPSREEQRLEAAKARGPSPEDTMAAIVARGEEARKTERVRQGGRTAIEAQKGSQRLAEIKARASELERIRKTTGIPKLDPRAQALIDWTMLVARGKAAESAARLNKISDSEWEGLRSGLENILKAPGAVVSPSVSTEVSSSVTGKKRLTPDQFEKAWLNYSATILGQGGTPNRAEFEARMREKFDF